MKKRKLHDRNGNIIATYQIGKRRTGYVAGLGYLPNKWIILWVNGKRHAIREYTLFGWDSPEGLLQERKKHEKSFYNDETSQQDVPNLGRFVTGVDIAGWAITPKFIKNYVLKHLS